MLYLDCTYASLKKMILRAAEAAGAHPVPVPPTRVGDRRTEGVGLNDGLIVL